MKNNEYPSLWEATQQYLEQPSQDREIKFRAWDTRWRKMKYTEHLSDSDIDSSPCCCEYDQIMLPHIFDSKYLSVIRFPCHPYDMEVTECDGIIMQFTGLKDKNGKEIYEGDILLGRFVLDEVEDHIFLSLTEDEKETQSKTFVVNDIFYPYTNQIPEDLEVIGNIYENPNLLSEKEE